jgi:hypothetical protein
MNNPIELAKFSILVSEGITKLISDENPQIDVPQEIMKFNQRQRIFLGLVAMHYVANYIKDEYKEHIRGKFTPLEIFIASMFAVGMASGGKFKILTPKKHAILDFLKKGVLSKDEWIVSDEEVEEMEKYKDIINDFMNKQLTKGFHFAVFLSKIVDEFPLEILVDFVLKTIFNLTFEDDFIKFPETVDFLIFVQYLVNYLNTKKEA